MGGTIFHLLFLKVGLTRNQTLTPLGFIFVVLLTVYTLVLTQNLQTYHLQHTLF